MSNEIDISKIGSIDDFYALTQVIGSNEKAIGNNLYGINHQKVKTLIPENKDSYGLAFFTRPQLNLSRTNLRNLRKFYSFLGKMPASTVRYVISTLDPELHYKNVTTPLVDPNMAFIPLLTNTLKSMSGWADEVLPTFTSKEGVRREQWSIGDGTTDIFDAQDIECVFRNIKDEPITMMFHLWTNYIAGVFEGMLSPYMDMILANEIDYNTRIYRLVTDESGLIVKKIAATGASFPVNNPIGKFFDFNEGIKYSDQTKDINIRFRSMGMMYNEDILIKEFNMASGIFNPDMRDGVIKGNLQKIPRELLMAFNNRGYPYINTDTLELEWYINTSSSTYKRVMNSLKGGN